LASTIRVPTEIYEALRKIRVSLERKYQSAAPAMQDLVTVALQNFMNDWKDTDKREQLLDQLLENRKMARANMGKPKTEEPTLKSNDN